MHFASDNTGPVHPAILDALAKANTGHMPGYGADEVTARAVQMVRDVFEAPEAEVHFVATGTAANVLSLASLCQPYQTVFCSDVAHIQEDECNAPEFFTGGAKLTLVPTEDARMTPEALRAKIAAEESRGVHGPKRGPVSITQITELGTLYDLDTLTALTDVARAYDLPVHMDGARFANALVALDTTPAEMTWKRGVDVVSFGGTKNGCMGVEAVVIFDPAKIDHFAYRRKRGAHLFSKHRYLSAQMVGYLEDGLWLDLARKANAANARLVEGLSTLPEARLAYDPAGNMTFADLPARSHETLFAAGAAYNLWGATLEAASPDDALLARFVCDWSTRDEDIDQFLTTLKG